MTYSEDLLVISHPSAKLMDIMNQLRSDKLERLQKLRSMKQEEFTRRVILA